MDQLLTKFDKIETDSHLQALIAIPAKQKIGLCNYMRDVHMLYHERLYESAGGGSESTTEEATELVTHRLFNN